MDLFRMMDAMFKDGEVAAYRDEWLIYKLEPMIYLVIDVEKENTHATPIPANMILHLNYNEDGSPLEVPAKTLEKAKELWKKNEAEIEKDRNKIRELCLSRFYEFKEDDVYDAHGHASLNRQALEKDEVCGCFYCCTIFNPKLIEEWIDNDQTAICPYCGIDSVIGKRSGYPITEEFLKAMKKEWF